MKKQVKPKDKRKPLELEGPRPAKNRKPALRDHLVQPKKKK